VALGREEVVGFLSSVYPLTVGNAPLISSIDL
jgi:hypothetical protein